MHRLPSYVRCGLRHTFIAYALFGVIACAQKPEERPLTHQEAQEELAKFQDWYKNAYVHLTPSAQVRLDSGVFVTINSAKVLKDRIRISGTLRNTNATATPPGYWNFLLNESFEFQIARYQKQPVIIGSCGGPCVSSHVSMSVYVKGMAQGQSSAYSVTSTRFSEQFPKAKASDMIVVVSFLRR